MMHLFTDPPMKHLSSFAIAWLLFTASACAHAQNDGKENPLYKQLVELRKQYDSLPVGSQTITSREPDSREIQAHKDRLKIQKEMEEVALKLARAEPGTEAGLFAIKLRLDFGHREATEFDTGFLDLPSHYLPSPSQTASPCLLPRLTIQLH